MLKGDDVIRKYEGRTTLGSKGTDLYYLTKEFGPISISNLQLLQTAKLQNSENVSEVKFQFLVNDETHDVVMNSFKSLDNNFTPEILSPIVQKKMPTLDGSDILTEERKLLQDMVLLPIKKSMMPSPQVTTKLCVLEMVKILTLRLILRFLII